MRLRCQRADATARRSPFSSTYAPAPSPPTLIRGVDGAHRKGTRIDNGDVLIGTVESRRSAARSPRRRAHASCCQRSLGDARLIDVHRTWACTRARARNGTDDGNEATDPVTSNVWAEHSGGRRTGLRGGACRGVTAIADLPGSANLIGGRGVTIKVVPATTYQAMKFPGAPQGLKMAGGENRSACTATTTSSRRRGWANVAGYRQAFADAQDTWRTGRIRRKTREVREGQAEGDEYATPPQPPKRDLKLETLAEGMRGQHPRANIATAPTRCDDARHRAGVWLPHFRVHHGVEALQARGPPRGRGVCGRPVADGGASRWRPTTASRKTSARGFTAGRLAIVLPTPRKNPALNRRPPRR